MTDVHFRVVRRVGLGAILAISLAKRSEVGSVEQLTVAGSILGSTATDDDILEAMFTQF